ncbi:hypothetical protein Lsha_1393, partial [Legionella shakespearei DSM 23087]
SDSRCSDSRCSDSRCSDSRCSDSRYSDSRYSDSRYSDSRYSDSRYSDSRRPERVFLREGSPESGMVPILRAKRRTQDDVERSTQGRDCDCSFSSVSLVDLRFSLSIL